MSNLNTAKSLIQADLDHARQVLDLWTNQISELERALKQIEAVGTSRDALQAEYRGSNTQALTLERPAAPTGANKRGRNLKNVDGTAASKASKASPDIASKRSRKLAERITVRAGQMTNAKTAKPNKAKGGKSMATPEAKFKDPNSEKTWSGRGRRPFWMKGDAQQYEIGSPNQSSARESKADDANKAAAATE